MQKNARQYTEDATTAIKHAVENLQSALETVEKPQNYERIEEALKACQNAYNQTTSTVSVLNQE